MKSVRFVEESTLCVYHSGAVMDMDDACRNEIWYLQSEMSQIKRKAMLISKDAQRYGLGSVLTNTYGKSCNETQLALNTWALNGAARRGLERWINNEYAAKRSDIRKRTIKSVVRAQRKMEEEGLDDIDYRVRVLSRLSEAFSQDARNFARVLGLADQHAAEADLEQTSEEVSVSPTKSKSLEEDRQLVVQRRSSPTSVLLGAQVRPKRNLGFSSRPTSVVADMRHYC